MTKASRCLLVAGTVTLASIFLGHTRSGATAGGTSKYGALVFGGGVLVGEAGEYGIIAGLAERGIDLFRAD
jgi:hypothetical protein